MQIHVVRQGDSLYQLSRTYGVPVQDILNANGITNPNQLVVGQALVIPTAPKPQAGPKPTMEVNAYVTDFGPRGQQAVRQLAPVLTYLSPFSHHVTADGSVEPLNDAPVVEIAKAQGVGPLLVLSNFSGNMFDSDLAKTILNNPTLRQRVITQVLDLIRSRGYVGLNIDFEYIYPADREAYNQFLREVVAALRPQGYLVATALAPKTSATQVGKLYEAHDYPVHGELCDFVVLMTYEWGWIGGSPMAVSPVNEIEKVLNYAVTAIPRNKIMMGVSVYGYDWTLPWVSGTLARTLSPQAAVLRAGQQGVDIKYDQKAQAPFYNYVDSTGKKHIVWFEDARSFKAKLDIAKSYRLRGISFWSYPTEFPQVPLVLRDNVQVKKLR